VDETGTREKEKREKEPFQTNLPGVKDDCISGQMIATCLNTVGKPFLRRRNGPNQLEGENWPTQFADNPT